MPAEDATAAGLLRSSRSTAVSGLSASMGSGSKPAEAAPTGWDWRARAGDGGSTQAAWLGAADEQALTELLCGLQLQAAAAQQGRGKAQQQQQQQQHRSDTHKEPPADALPRRHTLCGELSTLPGSCCQDELVHPSQPELAGAAVQLEAPGAAGAACTTCPHRLRVALETVLISAARSARRSASGASSASISRTASDSSAGSLQDGDGAPASLQDADSSGSLQQLVEQAIQSELLECGLNVDLLAQQPRAP